MWDKFKKLTVLMLIAAFISGAVPESILPQAVYASAAVPEVQASAYVVMDANSGDVIYKKGMNKKIYPASTTKLMTAIVVLENIDINKRVTFTKNMRKKVPSDASKLNLKAGTAYTVRQYLNMLLIGSDADSAIALASGAGISYNKFIKLMNSTAKSYGMSKTSFDNPMGLDIGNGYNKTYTSAYDFAIMARHAMSYELIRNIVAKSTYTVPARKGKPSFKVKNSNSFYSTYKLKNKEYKIIGSKTGTTRAAGRVLIATARDEEGHELICAYFGGNSSEALYKGIEKLLDYTFKQYLNDKITLAVGFWDTRFRDSEKIICKYATSGIIPMQANGKFSPDIVKNAANTTSLINDISGLGLEAGTESGLTVAGLAMAYYNNRNDAATGEELTDEELDIISSLENTEGFNISGQKQIAGLYLSGAMANVQITDVNHKITKEEAVLIADLLT